MSITPPETGPDPAVLPPDPGPRESDPAEVLRRRVYIGFAATVAVGLALAGLYIGGRLFARPAPDHEPLAVKTVAQPVAPRPRPSPFAVPPRGGAAFEPTAASAPTAPNTPAPGLWHVVTPKPGEKYLQLAALPLGFIGRYLAELEAKGFHPLVAPGPDENSYRILIGPFADQTALERQRDNLRAAGIEWILRVY